MNVIEHLERALDRSGSPYSLSDVLEWNALGLVSWRQRGELSGSWMKFEGALEVLHLGGKWTDEAGLALFEEFRQEAERLGLPMRVRGRKGWRRFLAKRGVKWE